MDLSTDCRKKASQWSLVIPSFAEATTARLLSSFPADEILCITFAILDDDAGNRYIQGFVKTAERTRISALIKLFGYGFCDAVSTPNDITHLLRKIQMNAECFEFGDESACNCQGQQNDITMFKKSVDMGIHTFSLLNASHTKLCTNCPNLVHDCVRKAVALQVPA